MQNQDIVANIISSSDYNSALKLLCVTNPSFLSIHKALLELKEKETCPFCDMIPTIDRVLPCEGDIEYPLCPHHDNTCCRHCGGILNKNAPPWWFAYYDTLDGCRDHHPEEEDTVSILCNNCKKIYKYL